MAERHETGSNDAQRVGEPGWVQDAIWWQVYPLGAVGAEKESLPGTEDGSAEVQHRLGRLHGWLDHLVRLGANGLALQPVFASQSHGYDTVDFFRVDPRLGNEEDLKELFAAAHQKGIRILLDGVFNHVGTGHPAFTELTERGPDASHADWFNVRFDGWTPGSSLDYDTFEGHTQLAALNHDNDAVADLVVEVMCHWLERGADGWRLDAAYSVDPSFWARVLPRVCDRFPDAYIVGEVIHGDYGRIVTSSSMNAVTQYELWKAVWSSLENRNFWELDHALGRHEAFLETFVPMTFVGNHDVTRIASQLSDARLLPLAATVLMTVAGTPALYYGDELGFRGVKEERLGGDDAIRPSLPDDPQQLGDDADWELFEVYRQLIGIRRRNRWLHTAATRVWDKTNTELVYESWSDQGRVVVALNSGDDDVALAVGEVRVVLGGTGRLDGEGDRTQVILPAFGWAVLA